MIPPMETHEIDPTANDPIPPSRAGADEIMRAGYAHRAFLRAGMAPGQADAVREALSADVGPESD